MNATELELFEKWQADPSFINWAKKANEVDTAKWDAYFNANPQQAALGDLAKFALLELQDKVQLSPVSSQKSQAALALLRTQIKQQQKSSSATVFSLNKLWRIAASLLLLIGCSYWIYNSSSQTETPVVWQAADEIKEVLLADGTKVTLNKKATLSYSNDNVRNVYLEGEAYFEVTKKSSPPTNFTVTTKDLVVEVLGTEFNVKVKDDKTSVYLDEGKVNLLLKENEVAQIAMQPGDLVSYSKAASKVLENRPASSLENTIWKETYIHVEDANLTEVLTIIQKIYNVNIEVEDAVDFEQEYTGGIPVQEFNMTLEALKTIYDLDMEKVEAKYLLKKRE